MQGEFSEFLFVNLAERPKADASVRQALLICSPGVFGIGHGQGVKAVLIERVEWFLTARDRVSQGAVISAAVRAGVFDRRGFGTKVEIFASDGRVEIAQLNGHGRFPLSSCQVISVCPTP